MTQYNDNDEWETIEDSTNNNDDWSEDDDGWEEMETPEVPEKTFGQKALGTLGNVSQTVSDSMDAGTDSMAYGFGPNISGASGAVLDPLFGQNPDKNLLERYRLHRNKALEERRERTERTPKGTTIGSIVGGLVSPAPGRGASLAAKSMVAAGQGAAAGLGYSDADLTKGDVKQAALDMVKSGGFAGSIPLIGPTLKTLGKKGMQLFSGVHPKIQEHYVSRNKQVKASRDVDEIEAELKDNIQKLKHKTIQDSKDALEFIPEDSMLPLAKIQEVLDEVSAKYKKSHLKHYKRISKDIDNIKESFIESAGQSKETPFRDIKKTLQEMDEVTTYSKTAGSFDKAQNSAYKQVRRKLDRILKEAFPEYENAMKKVAHEADTLSEASREFGKRNSAAAAKLKKMASRPQDRRYQNEILEDVDNILKTDLSSENADRLVREAFEKGHTAGSRNVNLGGGLSYGLGSLFGVPPGFSVPAGMLGGGMLDKWGPKGAQKILDAYIAIHGVNAPGVKELMQAIQRSNVPYGITAGTHNNP